MDLCQSTYCRLCAESKNFTELKNCGIDLNISEKINIKLCRINATMDSEINLPLTFCLECLNLLDNAFEFVNKVQKSQEILKKLASDAVEDIKCVDPADEESENMPKLKTECTSDNKKSYSEDVSPPVVKKYSNRKNSVIIEPVVTWNDVNWKCAVCSHNYSSYKDLIAHTMQEHSCCSAYICAECSAKRYNLNNFIKHIQKNHKPTLTKCCYECNATFTSSIKLSTHLKSKHTIFINVCSGCNANFNTIEELNEHTDMYYRKNFVLKQNFPVKTESAITWESYSWKCGLCEYQYPTSDDLITHSIETHSRCNTFSCIDCSIQISKLNRFIKHVQQQHRRPLTRSCYKCFQSFQSIIHTNKHRRVHKTSEYMCDGCNTCFQNIEEAKKHREDYYKENKQKNDCFTGMFEGLTCLVCYKMFSKTINLKNHLLMHQDRPKNYVCDECGKQYYNRHLLAEHKTIHSDAKPFKCEICGTAFKLRTKLTHHVKVVHTTKKIYICDHCNKSFAMKYYLRNHMDVHLDSFPWVCEVCNKGFKRKVFLRRHKRNHTGLKEYYCDACQHEFSYWSNYNKHMIRRHNMDMTKKKRKGRQQQLDDKMLLWKEQVCKPVRRGKKVKADLDTNVSDIQSAVAKKSQE